MANTRSTRRGSGTDYAPRDHYTEVTNQVIAALKAGTPPWRRPWDQGKTGGPSMPCNATTGASYHGINTLTLGMSPLAFNSGDPRWATYRQAAERGWQVKKGARSTTGYFYKRVAVHDESKAAGDEDATRRIPLLRAFALFHASQIDGVPDYVPPSVEEAPWRAPEATGIIVANSGADIRIGGDRAFYSPSTDHVQMPPICSFYSAAGWSSVVLHELAHWSGSPERLNRDLRGKFGSHDYAREELRAEISQMVVCSVLGLPDCDFSNNTAYIADWLKCLRSNRKEIFRAAAEAQRMAAYLLAFHPAYAEHSEVAGASSDAEDGMAADDVPSEPTASIARAA